MAQQSDSRRFPLPWTIGGNESCFWVEDADGKRLAYVYYRGDDASIGSDTALRLTRGEALRIVRNVAKLPELIVARGSASQATPPQLMVDP